MAKNPLLVDKIVLSGVDGGGIFSLSSGSEQSIVDSSGNIDAPVTTTNATFTGNTTLGDTTGDTVTINGTVNADALVGTNKKVQFRDTGLFINSGADGKLTISSDGSGTDDITLSGTVTLDDDVITPTTKKIQFRDSALYISSKDDGHLDLDADVSVDINGTLLTTGASTTSSGVGTPGTGVTAAEYGDSRFHMSVLTLTNVAVGTIAGAGNAAFGALIYTFPAGVHLHKVSYMSVGLTTAGATKTDTPDVGIGSVVGSGAQALLSGVGATSEDYITGQTAADVNGTATLVGPVGAVAGLMTGISLNKAADVKAVYLNAADGWDAGAAGALTATGTVVLTWEKLV